MGASIMKYYLGIDASTSCTGFAIIHESGVLVYKDYVYTKDLKSKAQSFHEVYDIIYLRRWAKKVMNE